MLQPSVRVGPTGWPGCVIAGIVSLVRGQMLWGILLIIVGLLVGPGGYSIFQGR